MRRGQITSGSSLEENSFYDVFNPMSEEALKRYRRFSGISSDSHYKEILQELDAESSEEASESNS